MTNQTSAETSCYILSAGRTGTVFLERLIREIEPSISVEHEPNPSRYLMMLGNLRNDLGLFGGVTRRWSVAQQRARHRSDQRYIEINPFLCAVTDTLPIEGRDLRVLHVVRHPADWARSITTFKASEKLRGVIDYVPFSKPYPSPRPADWSRCGDYEKALWRWQWCNSKIDEVASRTERHARIRYEDIFSDDAPVRSAALENLYSVFDLKRDLDLNHPIFRSRINPTPVQSDAGNPKAEREICGELAARYGYDLADG